MQNVLGSILGILLNFSFSDTEQKISMIGEHLTIIARKRA